MLNSIVLMGRLVADPELRTTSSNIPVCSFTVAVDRDFQRAGEEKQTDFIDVVAWRSTAEFVSRYFTKGRMIVVQGSLQSRKWQDRDGNKRVSWEVQAEKVFFGDSKRDGDSGSSNNVTNRFDSYTPPPEREQPSAYSSGSESDFTPLPDDDLPF